MKKIDGGVTTPLGWMAAGVHCGIKRERLDLALLYSEHPTIGACTFTQNRMRAAPVEYMVARKNHNIRAFIINSGNANAITGKQGYEDASAMVEQTARSSTSIPEVGVSSTGVIGRYLPMDKISAGITKAVSELARGRSGPPRRPGHPHHRQGDRGEEPPCRSAQGRHGRDDRRHGQGIRMISPSMKVQHARPSFITTDAVLTPPSRGKVAEAIDKSFNVINVDGDQSIMTSPRSWPTAPREDAVTTTRVLERRHQGRQSLAKQVVTDGENNQAHRAQGRRRQGCRGRQAGGPLDRIVQPGQDRRVRRRPQLRPRPCRIGQLGCGVRHRPRPSDHRNWGIHDSPVRERPPPAASMQRG